MIKPIDISFQNILSCILWKKKFINFIEGSRRSKFAIFFIVGFLGLLTYLLITVSTQVTNEQALNSDSYAMKAKMEETIDIEPIDPGEGEYPGRPITCSDYQQVIEGLREQLRALRKNNAICPKPPTPVPWMQPDVIVPENDCDRIRYLHTYINGLEQTIEQLCLSCQTSYFIPTPGRRPLAGEPDVNED